jgi:hypothetical protein
MINEIRRTGGERVRHGTEPMIYADSVIMHNYSLFRQVKDEPSKKDISLDEIVL